MAARNSLNGAFSPFPSSLMRLHQSEAWCTTIHMKMCLICIFIWKDEHQDSLWGRGLKCIWQIFFICSIKSPQCANKFFFSIAIFLPRVLMCQKRQISLPVGYKTAAPKTGDWERLWRQFRTPSLAKNRGIWVTVRSCCEKRIETKLCKSR